jgi:formamidopyrimidine-DNA glycosylase
LDSVVVHDKQVMHWGSADEFRTALVGRRFAEPKRHGKWLVLPTSGSESGEGGLPSVLLHFGMTGMLRWCTVGEEAHPHDRVVFHFPSGELRYRDMRKLKGLRLARQTSEMDSVLDGLGPDACTITRAELSDRLTRTRRQIKPALMDQEAVAGLGNLTVDELVWRARLPPWRATTELADDDWRRLHRAMRSMLRTAVRAGCVPSRPSWLTGHRDDPDGACPRCATTLRHGRTGGRSTVWCPRCQGDSTEAKGAERGRESSAR